MRELLRTARMTSFTLGAVVLLASPALSTPARDFSGSVQWEGTFPDIDIKTKTDTLDMKFKSKGTAVLVVTRITVGANGSSGWHTHPGFSMVTVLEGQITLYDAKLCTGRVINAGQTFVDEGGDHVHLVRNENGAGARLGVVQLVETGAPSTRRIDAPRPNNCAANIL